MIWALDLDDFKNICGCEEYPLLRTINRVLRDYSVPAPSCVLGLPEKRPQEKPTTQTLEPTTQTAKPTTQTFKPTYVEETTQKTTVTYLETATPPVTQVGGPCNGLLFVPDKTNCNNYYLCNQGQLQLQSCPSSLYWNRDHCDWPENTPCHPDVTTVVAEVPEGTPSTQHPEEIDGGVGEVPQITTTPRPSYPGTEVTEDGYKVVCYFTNWAWYR